MTHSAVEIQKALNERLQGRVKAEKKPSAKEEKPVGREEIA